MPGEVVRTPAGGDRSTQWVLQYRVPPADETLVTAWTRYWADPEFTDTAASTRAVLGNLRESRPEAQWRAIRVESVQRVEDW